MLLIENYQNFFRLYFDFFESGSTDELQFFKDQLDAGYGFGSEYKLTADMTNGTVWDVLELDAKARAFAVSNTSEFFEMMIQKWYPEGQGRC